VTLVAGEISEAQIVFDMKSLTVINLEGKLGKKFLGHLQSEDFFEVEKYPTATWKLDSTKGGVAQGTLTVKGKSHPIAIPFQKKGETYVGKVTFDRTKYGIVYRSGNFFKDLGDKMIKDDVEIGFELVLVQ
jgi:polyisoprenoid-binding protein YceI